MFIKLQLSDRLAALLDNALLKQDASVKADLWSASGQKVQIRLGLGQVKVCGLYFNGKRDKWQKTHQPVM
jgi:hypothetical protein